MEQSLHIDSYSSPPQKNIKNAKRINMALRVFGNPEGQL